MSLNLGGPRRGAELKGVKHKVIVIYYLSRTSKDAKEFELMQASTGNTRQRERREVREGATCTAA